MCGSCRLTVSRINGRSNESDRSNEANRGNESEDGSKSNRDSESHKDESNGEEDNQVVVKCQLSSALANGNSVNSSAVRALTRTKLLEYSIKL